MAEIVDKAVLQDDEYLQSLKKMSQEVGNFTQKTQQGFRKVDTVVRDANGRLRDTRGRFVSAGEAGEQAGKKAAKGFELSGFKVGLTSGLVATLTTKFIEFGQQAIRTLVNIGKQSAQTALEFDTLRAQLLAIFSGSKEAANEAFNFIQKKSKELGIDLTELSAIFLPKVESLEQFERLAKLATAIARTSPQGQQAAIIGLGEALTGQFTSLQRRANIAKSDVDQIKKAFEEGGIEGFLKELDAVLTRTGRSFEATADTAQAAMNKVSIAGKQLGGTLGEPIVDALKEQLDELGAILEERDVDFTAIANAVGEVVANIVDFVGSGLSDFLANLDTEQVLSIVNNFQGMLDTAQDLVEILDLLEIPQKFLDGLEGATKKLDEALLTALKLYSLAEAERARSETFRRVLAEESPQGGLGGALGGLFAGDEKRQQIETAKAKAQEAAEKAYQDVILETKKILDETDMAEEEREKKRETRRSRRRGDDSGAADAILAEMEAARQAGAALEEYEAALEKVTEAQVELEEELEQRGSDIMLDAERKRFDAMQEFAEKRAAAIRKNLQKIEDIERDHGRDLEDNERDRARAFIDQAKEEANEKLNVEEKYQETLADIRERSFYDLEEAARNRDAIQFLRILRDQQQQVQEAETTRDRDLDDVRVKGEEKRNELRTQQERENEDARIAADRKLEDNRIAIRREFDEIRLAEQVKEAEIQTWQERQLEDLNTWAMRKQETINQQMATELEIVKNYEAQKTAVVEEELKKRQELYEKYGESIYGSQIKEKEATGGQADFSIYGPQLKGKQHGGPVYPGQPYIVGERGPEIFSPSQAGIITPTITNPMVNRSVIYNNTVDNRTSVNQSMLSPGEMNATMRAIARNEALLLLNDFVKGKR